MYREASNHPSFERECCAWPTYHGKPTAERAKHLAAESDAFVVSVEGKMCTERSCWHCLSEPPILPVLNVWGGGRT